MLWGIFAIPGCLVKAVFMPRLSDPAQAAPTVLFAFAVSIFLGPLAWSFLFSLVHPFLSTTPQIAKFATAVRRLFVAMAIVCWTIMFCVILLQRVNMTAQSRRTALSTAFFISLSFIAGLDLLVISFGSWKVRGFVLLQPLVSNPSVLVRFYGSHSWISFFQLAGLIDEAIANSVASRAFFLGMRRKLLMTSAASMVLISGIVLISTCTLLVPIMRIYTWIVLPGIIFSGICTGHACMFFVDSMDTKKKRKQPAKAPVLASSSVAPVLASISQSHTTTQGHTPESNTRNLGDIYTDPAEMPTVLVSDLQGQVASSIDAPSDNEVHLETSTIVSGLPDLAMMMAQPV
jgi:hypothetical protein